MAFYTDLLNAFLPILMVLLPAIITFSILGTKISFVAGALIGIAVGVSAENAAEVSLIPEWALVMGIILLATILFIDSDTIGS